MVTFLLSLADRSSPKTHHIGELFDGKRRGAQEGWEGEG